VNPRTHVVLGATGGVGSHLVDALTAARHHQAVPASNTCGPIYGTRPGSGGP
jgi:nucleoside-diphosphate-sugar epimerase